jgi:hypothetical protein
MNIQILILLNVTSITRATDRCRGITGIKDLTGVNDMEDVKLMVSSQGFSTCKGLTGV